MSVPTEADKKIAQAKEHIKNANKLLLEAISPDTWGNNQWREDYVNKIMDAILKLYKMHKEL